MVSITVSLNDKLYHKLEKLSWVNWSELAREKLLKKEIFENFIKTGSLSDSDQKICDGLDWYPVDWLEIKDEYIEKLKRQSRRPARDPMSVEEFNKWADSL